MTVQIIDIDLQTRSATVFVQGKGRIFITIDTFATDPQLSVEVKQYLNGIFKR